MNGPLDVDDLGNDLCQFDGLELVDFDIARNAKGCHHIRFSLDARFSIRDCFASFRPNDFERFFDSRLLQALPQIACGSRSGSFNCLDCFTQLIFRLMEPICAPDAMDLPPAVSQHFLAQAIAVSRGLELDMSKTNPNGGAIALGHPIGCTGARILVTLLYEMRRRRAKRGLATLCVSGGMGMAMALELM